MSNIAALEAGLIALDLPFEQEQCDLWLSYLALLQKWNKAYNLTAITDSDEMLVKHIFDSLAIARYVDGASCLDVGTGAGLPGIVLAILFPNKKFTLLDSNGKKTRFLTQVKLELGLKNVDVVKQRIELFSQTGQYDCILSRAFASIASIVERTSPFCQQEGEILAMRGEVSAEEIREISSENILVDVIPLKVPKLDATRTLVKIKKVTHG